MRLYLQVLTSILALLSPAVAPADVPDLIPFQGVITDGQGDVVAAGTLVQFALWDAPDGGTIVWGPESHVVAPVNGVVSVLLGGGSPSVPIGSGFFSSAERHLSVSVQGSQLSPRVRMASTAYAFVADQALHVVAGSVGTESLADGAVVTSKLAPGSVTVDKLAEASVGTSAIQDGQVAEVDLSANSVTTAKMADAAVTAEKLASGSVTTGSLASGFVVSRHYIEWSGSSPPFDVQSGTYQTVGLRIQDGPDDDFPPVLAGLTRTYRLHIAYSNDFSSGSGETGDAAVFRGGPSGQDIQVVEFPNFFLARAASSGYTNWRRTNTFTWTPGTGNVNHWALKVRISNTIRHLYIHKVWLEAEDSVP